MPPEKAAELIPIMAGRAMTIHVWFA